MTPDASDDFEMSQEELADCMDWTAFHEVLLDAAELIPGQRVLDVGCGFGATTLSAATRVTPGGFVVGIDNDPDMLSRARQSLGATTVDNVELLAADAQTHPYEAGSFDVLISAFGLMFFDHLDLAFHNLRAAMRPGGRLAFTSWQQLSNAEWFVVVTEAMAGHVGRPSAPPTNEPGPFSFSDPDWVGPFLHARGFGDVEVQAVSRPERVGRTLDEAVRVVTSLPVVHAVLAAADPRATADAITSATEAMRPYAGPDGVVTDATVWLVTAANEG